MAEHSVSYDLKGYTFGILAAASSAALVFFIHNADAGVGDLLFLRAICFLIVCIPIAGPTNLKRLFRKEVLPIWLRSLFATVAISIYFYVLQNAEISQITTIYAATPVTVMVIARLVLHEVVRKVHVIAALLVLLGIVVMKFDVSESAVPLTILILSLVSLVFRACALVALRKAAKDIPSSLILIGLSVGLLVASLFLNINFEKILGFWSDIDLVGFVVTSFLSHLFLIVSYKYLQAGLATLLMHFNVFFATFLGMVFHNYYPSSYEYAGLVLIIVSGFLIKRSRHISEPSPVE